MAENTKKKPVEKTSVKKKTKRNKDFPITGIYKHLTFTEEYVKAWVTVPLIHFELLPDSDQIKGANTWTLALSNLVNSPDKNVETDVFISSYSYDALRWVEKLYDHYSHSITSPYYPQFLEKMYNYVLDRDFKERIVLIGVNIGRRADFRAFNAKNLSSGLLNKVIDYIAVAPTGEYISNEELDYWVKQSSRIINSLISSPLKCSPAEAVEIAYVIRKQFFPAMPSPSYDDLIIGNVERWGEGEIGTLVDAEIVNNPKYLEIKQVIKGKEHVGYRATLCFSKFPEEMDFPSGYPWIYYAGLLDFPLDFALHFTLEPPQKVKKEIGRKNKDTADQAANMTSAGGSTNIEIEERARLGEELEYILKNSNLPWLYGRHRIQVEASSKEELYKRAQEVIDHYRQLDIIVSWPTGDQLSLLKEGIPGDKVRIPSYYQQQDLSVIGTGVPNGAGRVGDKIVYEKDGSQKGWIGTYLGETLGNINAPVFFDPFSTIDTNHPNVVGITGMPGQGKTFAALTIVYQMALSGAWIIYIDPKNDAASLAKMPGMENRVTNIDITYGQEGLLDPFSIANNPAKAKELALESIFLLLGGQTTISEQGNIALARAIDAVTSFPEPSLMKIVDYLSGQTSTPAAMDLGARLRMLSTLPYARLCFASGASLRKLRPEVGTTIITIQNLSLPTADTLPENYELGEKLGVTIMYLLSNYAKQLMTDSEQAHHKAIVIDEAWAILATRAGHKLVNEISRLGRSHNTALMLITQGASEFVGDNAGQLDGIVNSISTRISFKAEDGGKAVIDTARFLGMPKNEESYQLVSSLEPKQAIIRDWAGRRGIFQVDVSWNDMIKKNFETNPNARAENQRLETNEDY